MIKDVHTEHCCKRHGCKYGALSRTECTVVSGQLKQSFECEQCAIDNEDRSYWVDRLREDGWTVTRGDV